MRELLSLLPGVVLGLLLSAAWRWARGRRERRSQDASLLLAGLDDAERELGRAMALRERLWLRSGREGEWWRPAAELAAGLREAALLCGDPRLARLPGTVTVEEVVDAAARARAALHDEVLLERSPPAGLVLVRRSVGGRAARAPRG